VDFSRNNFEFLPNEVYEFLRKSRSNSLGALFSKIPDEDKTEMMQFVEYILEKDFAFLVDENEIQLFPEIDMRWDDPAILTNCIIDFDTEPEDLKDYRSFLADLDNYGCENIQFRIYRGLGLKKLRELLSFLDETAIHRIEIIINFSEHIKQYLRLLNEFPRINDMVLHSANTEKIKVKRNGQVFILTKQIVASEQCCGVISPKYFNFHQSHFYESHHFNTCLNRKISVDTRGNIKNCPSLKKSYGTIRNSRISDILSNPEFCKIWSLNKQQIEDCKVCEFRNVCTDCRAYLEKDTSLKKPANCNYNPYGISN